MARTETMVQLTDELLDVLDIEARRRGISRSALIREALTAHFAASAEAVVTKKIVDGYIRIPQSAPDEWGDLQVSGDSATRETLQRLDAEERKAGHKPW